MRKKLGILAVLAALLVVSMAGTVLAAPGTWTVGDTGISTTAGSPRPSVCWDGTNYHIWYNDGTGQRHATSTNGTTWTIDEDPVTLLTDAPFVIKVGGTFYMYAPGKTSGSEIDDAIFLYSSTDGISWASASEAPVFTMPDTLARIDQPMVLYDGGYKLYYQATPIANGDARQIGVATSNSLAGPFKNEGIKITDIDGKNVLQPWVVKDGDGTYYMFFSYGVQSIYVATSTDGIAWGDPQFSEIESTGHSHYPSVFVNSGNWLAIFGESKSIKSATAQTTAVTSSEISWSVTASGGPTYPDAGVVNISVVMPTFGSIAQGTKGVGTITITNATDGLPVNVVIEKDTSDDAALVGLGTTDMNLARGTEGTCAVTITVPIDATPGSYAVGVTVTATPQP